MNFITIDFETATSDRNSPCEIGLTFVEHFKIVKSRSWLIKPIYDEFDYFNISIHGINPEDVKDKPEFDELWKEIRPLVENKFLIAHNAGFDFSVLRKTLETYNIPFPNLRYSCSYIFSKKIWEGLPAYDLKTLCRFNKIELNHHRAESDSRATAELSIKAFKEFGVTSFDDFPSKLKTNIGELFDGGYKPSTARRVYKISDLAKIEGDPKKQNTNSIFFGKKVVFTGTLSSMIRREAQQIIADIGGINELRITKSTNFLIVGQQDYKVVGEDGMSNKQKTVIKYVESGLEIEMLSENEFMRNI